MTQTSPLLFNSGSETASLVASSGLLSSSWKLISDLYKEPKDNLFWKKVPCDSDLTIVVFGTTLNDVQSDLLPSSDIMDNPFEFILPKSDPNLSLNLSAISLFNEHRSELRQLISEIDLTKPVIVTGHAVGGAIASLFTLWLLEKLKSGEKRPLCITFGSPLIGDKHLQEAICRSSNSNSCFLNVASHRDPLPSSLISTDIYRPFGTFLFCSDYGSACSENPESILILLKHMRPLNQGLQNNDYGAIVENLHRKAVCKDSTVPSITSANVLQASLTLQLCALGFPQLLQNIDLNKEVKDLERQELLLILNKRKRFIPNKKLDEMKTYMAQLEWYKKTGKNQKRGYYDNYRNEWFPFDQDVLMFVKILNNYWKDMVEEVEKQPRKEGRMFRTRWLYAGTNYRRMVEPLDIAQYYREGGKDYINRGRSNHYRQLERWLEEEKKPESISRQNVHSILTLDSCFWAHVEEALIWLEKWKTAETEEASARLEEFENYVYGQLKKYAVSPEIFLEGSSYMKWWNDYIKIKGGPSNYNSPLADFMKYPANYEKYEKGDHDFP